MELDFDKYCVVDGSPTTVLSAVRHSKVSNRKSNGKPRRRNHMLSKDGDFTEIRFDSYIQSRRSSQEDIKMMTRGSAYQGLEELMQLRGSNAAPERKKIEFSGGHEAMSSYRIIDSLCNSDEDTSPTDQERLSVMSGSGQSTSSFCHEHTEIYPQGSVNYAFHPIRGRIGPQKVTSLDGRDEQSSNHQSVKDDLKLTSESAVGAIYGGNNSLCRRTTSANLNKSLPRKLASSQSPVQYKNQDSKSSSPDFQFSPARKTFDPFFRPKPQKSPLSRVSEIGSETRSGHIGSNVNGTLQESMLNVSLDKQHHVGYNSQCEVKENRGSVPLRSPAHLRGLLKLRTKRGVPFFKFSVKLPEESYVARTWKVDNTLNWIYTFHSVNHRRNSNAVGWRLQDSIRDSSMVGQMLVSCYLSTELQVAGASSNSMVTEFVLYDVAHLGKNNSSQDNSRGSPDASKPSLASGKSLLQCNFEQNKVSTKKKNSCDSGQLESSASQPLGAATLCPGLEIAVIVIQVPFEKRESLKFKSGDTKIDTLHPKLLYPCQLENANDLISFTENPGKMHVVIPAGRHSTPSTESFGPSPLLDRWRLGGGCDCGGWDLACPLTVFSNPKFHVAEGQSLVGNQHPAELICEGRKDNAPAFSMRAVEEGNYAIDFHAQLSSLQAFAICVALLHAAEASAAVGHDRCRARSDSARAFPHKEIERFTDAIMEEQNLKAHKITDGVMPSFVVNPPFSPIARV